MCWIPIEEDLLDQNGGPKAQKLPTGLGHQASIHADHYWHMMSQS